MRERPSDATAILEGLYSRYEAAPTPKPKQKHSIWYRMKRLIWRLWTRWKRITLNQHYDNLDGTNNACERLIGWWIKERYRTMRGYKRTLSIRNVVAVTSLLGAAAGAIRYDLFVCINLAFGWGRSVSRLLFPNYRTDTL